MEYVVRMGHICIVYKSGSHRILSHYHFSILLIVSLLRWPLKRRIKSD